MNWLNYPFYVVKDILAVYSCLWILQTVFGCKIKRHPVIMSLLLFIIIITDGIGFYICPQLETRYNIYSWGILDIFSSYLLPLSAGVCLVKGRKVLIILLYYWIIDLFSVLFTDTSENFTVQTIITILCVLMINGAVFIFTRKHRFLAIRKFHNQIPKSLYILTWFIAAALTVWLDTINAGGASNSEIRIITTLLALIIIIAAAYTINRSLLHQASEAWLTEQMDMQLRHYADMQKKNEDIRRFRHDYKNHMFCVQTLLKSGKYNDALQYLEQLTLQINETSPRYMTGNYIADAILTEKSSLASSLNTTIIFEGALPAEGIAQIDLGTILCNALDNALEACEQINDQCCIRIISRIKNGTVFLTINNPTAHAIKLRYQTIETTKKDKASHGFGLRNIRHTAEKYNGTSSIRWEDGIFSLSVCLPMNEKNTDD